MRQWAVGDAGEVPYPLSDTAATSSGNPRTSDRRSLQLWLSISLPLVFLLALTVFVLFCWKWKKKKKKKGPFDTVLASPSLLPMYHRGRRRGGLNSKMATLTAENEEALASWRIEADNIKPLNPLGAGVYGTVWLATYMGETVVVKKLSPPMPSSIPRTKSWRKNNVESGANSGSSSTTRATSNPVSGKTILHRFLVDVRFLSTLSHSKIVAFYGVAWTSPSKLDVNSEPTGTASDVQMVLEYMTRGRLRDYLARTRSDVRARTWGPRKLSMALDIAEALAYLHSRQPHPVLHCDLTSRNIYLDSTYTAKVADFGCSRYGILQSMESEEEDDDDAGLDIQYTTTCPIGTNRWVSPELLSGDTRYSTAVDMYSFGVILSELDSHELPFSEVTLSSGQPLPESAVMELIRTGAIRPSLSNRCPRAVEVLVLKCLDLEPSLRPTAAQAVENLRALLERERRVSDIGDDVSASDQNSFLGAKEDTGSAYSNSSIDSSILSIERGFNYAVLEER